jgi:hypothetical protein
VTAAGGEPAPRLAGRYRLPAADGRGTEALVAAGAYGYRHSCVTSESFPVRDAGRTGAREIVLLVFDVPRSAPEALAAAAGLGLARPSYEDALRFGAAHPEVQRAGPVVFLHDPWLGFFGRLDVICLWDNAGRRELGLAGYEERWGAGVRFAFVGPPAGA